MLDCDHTVGGKNEGRKGEEVRIAILEREKRVPDKAKSKCKLLEEERSCVCECGESEGARGTAAGD